MQRFLDYMMAKIYQFVRPSTPSVGCPCVYKNTFIGFYILYI